MSKAVIVHQLSKDFVLNNTSRAMKNLFVEIFKKSEPKNRQLVLDKLDLEIKHGQFFGIAGRNGSGKSTLLKVIAGIYPPASGSVKVNGSLVPFIELGVGFNGELTGRENIYLGGALLGFTTEQVDGMYQDIVDFAELEPFMHKKLKNYSSGMSVRLAFSLAVRARGDILLIDEVLAVGDSAFQKKCFNYFKQLKKAKKTVIFVSHNMKIMSEYCDRAALIENGRIVARGDPKKIARAYQGLFR